MITTFDWTNIDKPYLEKGRYFWAYSIAQLEEPYLEDNEKSIYTTRGLRQLLDYFGRVEPDELDDLVDDSLQHYELYLDPKSACNAAKVLVSISEEELKKLSKLVYDTELLKVYSTTVKEFEDNIQSLTTLLKRYRLYSEMQKSFLFVDDFYLDLKMPIREVERYPQAIASRAMENETFYEPQSSQVLKILFTNDNKFVGAILDNKELMIGFDGGYNRIQTPLNSKFANNFVVQLDEVSNFARLENATRERQDWHQFFKTYIKYGEVSFRNKKGNDNELLEGALGSGVGLLNRTGLPNFVLNKKDFFESEIDRFKRDALNVFDLKCEPLDPTEVRDDVERLLKARTQKEAEDVLLNNAALRVSISEENRNVSDYIGDAVIDDITNLFRGGPTTLEEVYENVFNYVSMDVLVDKAIKCIVKQGELPELWKTCIDIYAPPIITLPDNINIPDLFGFISDLIIRALLFAIQQALFAILDLIIKKLDQCFRGDLLDFTQRKVPSEYFGGNLDEVNTILANRILEDLEDLEDLRELSTNSSTGQLLSDIANSLTPQEFCSLIRGTASEEVYRIVLCLIETKYKDIAVTINSVETIRSLFGLLGGFLNTEACDIDFIIPVPTSANLCITDEQQELRKSLLNSKYQNISKDILDRQMSAAEQRRLQELQKLTSFLNSSDPIGDMVSQSGDMDSFVRSLVPCSKDNEPMKHIIKISTDAIIDPMSSYFSQAMLNNASNIKSSFYEPNRGTLRSGLLSQDFYSVQDNEITFKVFDENLTISIGDNFSQDLTYKGLDINNVDEIPAESIENGRREIIPQLMNNEVGEEENEVILDFITFHIIQMIAKSDIYQTSSGDIDTMFNSIVSDIGEVPLYENCWVESKNVREGIVESYLEEECKTKGDVSYQEIALTGLIRLYVRALVVEFYFKNNSLITQYHVTDFIQTFVKPFIERESASLFEAINKTKYIDSIEELINEQLATIEPIIRRLFAKFTNSEMRFDGRNVLSYYINRLEIVDKDPEFVPRKSFWIKIEENKSSNQTEFDATVMYSKTIGDRPEFVDILEIKKTIPRRVVTPREKTQIYEEIREEIILSREMELIFYHAIPSNSILSAVSIANFIRISSNIFDQLLILNEAVIANVLNADNFTNENTSFNKANKRTQIASFKEDRRKQNLKELIDE